ncbi:hypothetical protein HK096_006323 [Nowakowskiella sp. JEL0078]|nr:hypothetical protein HK096_006323 [Nowakowskiella sp. JEL0078]
MSEEDRQKREQNLQSFLNLQNNNEEISLEDLAILEGTKFPDDEGDEEEDYYNDLELMDAEVDKAMLEDDESEEFGSQQEKESFISDFEPREQSDGSEDGLDDVLNMAFYENEIDGGMAGDPDLRHVLFSESTEYITSENDEDVNVENEDIHRGPIARVEAISRKRKISDDERSGNERKKQEFEDQEKDEESGLTSELTEGWNDEGDVGVDIVGGPIGNVRVIVENTGGESGEDSDSGESSDSDS